MADGLAGADESSAVSKPQTQDRGLTDILSATLQENLVSAYLSNVRDHINPHTVLATKHIQLLLYLTLNPPPKMTPHDLDPLILLQRILSFHSPSDLAQSLPSVAASKDSPIWLRWSANKGIEATLKKALTRCAGDGIWGFVWKYGGQGELVKGVGGQSEEEEEIEDDEYREVTRKKETRQVSERGWDLLGWFCDVWEKDRQEHKNGYSPMFLKQIPQPFGATLKLSDAQRPLSIVTASLKQTASDRDEDASSVTRRRGVGKRIFELLLVSAQGNNPPFNPSSLSVAILTVFRELSTPQTLAMLLTFGPSSPIRWNIPLHLVMLLLEDLAGTRLARTQARSKGQSETVQLDKANHGFGKFPPPTWDYTLELMTMRVVRGWKGIKEEEKMGWGKLFLSSSMMARNTGGLRFEGLSLGKDWVEQVEGSLMSLGEEGGYKKTIMALVGLIQK